MDTNSRISPRTKGRYDDVIEWLDWFAGILVNWRDGKPITGAVNRLSEYRLHASTVTETGFSP